MLDLYIRNTVNGWKETLIKETFSSYKEAVIRGQELVGPGLFFVDTGARAPSRAEQLLEPEKKTKRQQKLDEL